jgi:NADH-quinone oxidoreductase subunit J
MRALALAVCLALGALALGAGAAPAYAQEEPLEPQVAVAAEPVEMIPTPQAGKGQAFFFWLFALISVGGAILTITRRNAVMAVMSLVGTFLGISAIYALLYAHFIAVIQILVYAGAIMVLFVFVVMILNKEEEEPWALRGLVGKALAGLALVYLTVRLIQVMWRAPAGLVQPATMAADFGSTHAVAVTMFGPYLFPFEAISLVLLIAVVGALVLAHPAHPNVGEEELS